MPTVKYSCMFISLLLLAMLTLLSCSEEKDMNGMESTSPLKKTSEIRPGKIYRLPLPLSPATLDPAYLQDQYGISVAVQLFDGLVQFGPYLSLQPAVAKNWNVSDNGRTFKFFLRSDVFFHHGRRVTARDVVFSLQRLIKARPAPSILPHLLKIQGAQEYRQEESQDVAGLNVVDDLSLVIHLDKPHAPLLNALAMYQAAIVPEEVVREQGDNFGVSPVGCGPFRMVSWAIDGHIRLQRFSDYYAGSSYLDGVEFRLYPDGKFDSILDDFISGAIHEMPVYGDVQKLKQNKEQFHWEHRPSLGLLFYGVNTDHPLLRDVRFRRALSLAIDRKTLTGSVYNDQFEPAYTVLPPGMPAHYRRAELPGEGLAEAQQLMGELRAEKNNFAPEIEVASASNSAFAHAELDFVEQSWAAIGVQMKRSIFMNWSKFEAYLRSGEAQVYRYSWTADIPDPDNFLRPLFSSGSPDNHSHYIDKNIDALLNSANSIVDDIERSNLYQKIERMSMHSYAVFPLFYLSTDRVYQSSVQGIQSSALGAHTVRLHRVWIDSEEDK